MCIHPWSFCEAHLKATGYAMGQAYLWSGLLFVWWYHSTSIQKPGGHTYEPVRWINENLNSRNIRSVFCLRILLRSIAIASVHRGSWWCYEMETYSVYLHIQDAHTSLKIYGYIIQWYQPYNQCWWWLSISDYALMGFAYWSLDRYYKRWQTIFPNLLFKCV